jgi:acylphosphatase
MENVVRWQCRATGTVQGVNYRARVAIAARERAIVGSVENRPDGSVFIDAQGAPAALEEFLHTIRGPRGPSDARQIHRLAELPASPDLVEFVIRR